MWRERGLYPVFGVLSIIAILYLNFGDKIRLPILWQPDMTFVRTNTTHFTIDGHPFYINGWNSYWLMKESAWGPQSRSRVSKMLRRGSQMGMTVCRTWAFSDGGDRNNGVLQISPGVFDERVFEALDFVIVEARRYRIRLILSLVNNLKAFGGKSQYVSWAREGEKVNLTEDDSFFSDPVVKGYYKNYVKAILTRKNSFSGVKYSEEPAIFAWELMNEPRCISSSSGPVLQAWIAEMSAFVKSLDHKHLVTVGLEGFYGPTTTERLGENPGNWAASLGSDFLQNSAVEHIDFASAHAYPDSWIPNADLEEKVMYLSRWVDSHVNDSEHVLKKPVLFTEVGSSMQGKQKGLYSRDLLLKTVYDKIYESAKKREAGAGALIWQLIVERMEEDDFAVVAWDYPSTYKMIVEQSCRLRYIFDRSESNRKFSHAAPCSGFPY